MFENTLFWLFNIVYFGRSWSGSFDLFITHAMRCISSACHTHTSKNPLDMASADAYVAYFILPFYSFFCLSFFSWWSYSFHASTSNYFWSYSKLIKNRIIYAVCLELFHEGWIDLYFHFVIILLSWKVESIQDCHLLSLSLKMMIDYSY